MGIPCSDALRKRSLSEVGPSRGGGGGVAFGFGCSARVWSIKRVAFCLRILRIRLSLPALSALSMFIIPRTENSLSSILLKIEVKRRYSPLIVCILTGLRCCSFDIIPISKKYFNIRLIVLEQSCVFSAMIEGVILTYSPFDIGNTNCPVTIS